MINTKFRNTQLEYVANNIDIQESIPNNFSQDKISKSEFDNMLEEMPVSILSEYEKKLFFTIIEDKYITTKEAESLTYEQIKKIKDVITSYSIHYTKLYDRFSLFLRLRLNLHATR